MAVDLTQASIKKSKQFKALSDAVARGNSAEVKKLINKNPWLKENINRQNDDGSTLLMTAAFKGFLKIIDVLLSYNADPNLQDGNGCNTIICAIYAKNIEGIELLLKNNKLNIDLTDNNNVSALLYAVSHNHNHNEIVETLLQHKADPNLQDKRGWSPLITAVLERNLVLVKMLLDDARTDTELKNADGDSAFSLAIKENNSEITQLLMADRRVHLLSAGLNSGQWKWAMQQFLQVMQGQGLKTPNTDLCFCALYGRKDVFMKRIAQGHDPNQLDSDGWSPLMYAVSGNQVEIVKLLLEITQVNSDLTNPEGNTALELAFKENNESIIELFKEKLSGRNVASTDDNQPSTSTDRAYSVVTETLVSTTMEPQQSSQQQDINTINSNSLDGNMNSLCNQCV